MVDTSLQDKDFNWFLQNYMELFKEYGKKYLAIKSEMVLGAEYSGFCVLAVRS